MGLPERLAAQRRLSQQSDEIGRRIIAAVEQQIPAYASISEAQLHETRAIASWAVQRLLEMWVDDSAFTEADLRRFRGIGVARATDGRPLQAVLRAYRVSAVEAMDLIVESSRSSLGIDDIIALNRTLLTSIEDLSEALFSGYTTTVDQMNRDPDQSVVGLVHDLLSGRHTSVNALADRTAQLGITIPATVDLVVVRPQTGGHSSMSEGDLADLAGFVAATATTSVLHARRDDHGVVLCAHAPDLSAELKFRDWVAGVVRHVTVSDLPAQYRLMASAVRHAPAGAFARGHGIDLADAMLVGLLRGQPPVDPQLFAAIALGDLLTPDHSHLLGGLEAYLAHGSSTAAATALGVHAQTMRHRLRRIAAVTGRDLRSSWDRLVLSTAHAARTVGVTP